MNEINLDLKKMEDDLARTNAQLERQKRMESYRTCCAIVLGAAVIGVMATLAIYLVVL